MAQFDVHARADDDGYFLDCQSNLLAGLTSRFVVPLIPGDGRVKPAGRLNPVFEIAAAPHVMMTEFASTVRARALGRRVTTLAEHSHQIIGALDMLIGGV